MKRLELGSITRPPGVRGEVRVKLHNPDSDALASLDSVQLRFGKTPERTMKIQGARHTAKGALVKFVGVVDMDAAEALRDYVVLADRALLPPLQPGEYYLSDLVGATVSGPEGTIGTVREVCIHPTIETIVIDRAEGGSVELPLVDEWLGKVDTEAGQIELLSLDGLLD